MDKVLHALHFWLLSLCTMLWRFIHVLAYIITSFPFIVKFIHSMNCMYVVQFVYYSPIDGNFVYFHLSVLMNSTHVHHKCVYMFKHLCSVLFCKYLGVRWWGLMVILCLAFWRSTNFHSGWTIFHFHYRWDMVLISQHLYQFAFCL